MRIITSREALIVIAILALLIFRYQTLVVQQTEAAEAIRAEVPSRSDVLPEDQWNLTTVYASDGLWLTDFMRLRNVILDPAAGNQSMAAVLSMKGTLHESPERLRDALSLSFDILRQVEKLHAYAMSQHHVDTANELHKTMFENITSLAHRHEEMTAWIQPEILSFNDEVIARITTSEALSGYRQYLSQTLEMREHTLSAELENVLARAAKSISAPAKIFEALNNADLTFGIILDSNQQEFALTQGSYSVALRSNDCVLRRNAFKVLNAEYRKHKHMLAETLQSHIEGQLFVAKMRKFNSTLEAALKPKQIDTSVYTNLIDTVRANIGVLHKYIRLRHRIMNRNRSLLCGDQQTGDQPLHLWDLYVPLTVNVTSKPRAPANDTAASARDRLRLRYHEAVSTVVESVAALGAEYQETLRRGLTSDGWVDRFENRNKRPGAYSSGGYDTPPFMLLNFNDDLRSDFTLAHESGHSMHSFYSRRAQPYHYSQYSIFVAEVASTLNEGLLHEHLDKKLAHDSEQRIRLLNEAIENIRLTVFRQTLFAEFELRVHQLVQQQIPLTVANLNRLYLELNTFYFGNDSSIIVIDEDVSIEWARIPHFYFTFYVYQYATGISAAYSLLDRILDSNSTAGAVERYLAFLEAGCSVPPIEALQRAGVDLRSSAPIVALLDRFGRMVDQLESLLQ